MSVTSAYVLHGIKTPGAFYSQIEDASPSPQVSAMLGAPAGIPWPMFRGVRGIRPSVGFRTTQLATLLGEASVMGADLSAGNTDLHYRAVTNLGTRLADATAGHMRLRMAKAFLHWSSITARHQGDASASAEILTIYDGVNVPIVAAGSLALAGAPTAAEYFGLGPVKVNGATLAGLQEATIDLGPSMIQAGSASEPYDTFLAVREINPVITLRGLANEIWSTYAMVGAALTSCVVYLRKYAVDSAGTAYVADVTAQHISFTGAAGVIAVEGGQAGGNSEAMATLRLYLRTATAGTCPLVIAPAVAIT